jgi:urease accessory protein
MFAVISRSEPAPPIRLQRTRGEARARFVFAGGTRLADLFQDGAAKIRLPRTSAGDGEAEAILINTAGGLTGGDRMSVTVEVGAGASVVATTQACEKIYRSSGGAALVEARLRVAAGARLDWLPQETILFDGAELRRLIDVDIEPEARFLAVEAIIFGRRAMGERLLSGVFHDRWRVRRGGRLLHADDVRMTGALGKLNDNAAVLAGGGAMASVLYVGDDADRRLEAVRSTLGGTGGASAFSGKLVARVVAADGLSLRRLLVPALEALRGGRPLPKTWRL